MGVPQERGWKVLLESELQSRRKQRDYRLGLGLSKRLV